MPSYSISGRDMAAWSALAAKLRASVSALGDAGFTLQTAINRDAAGLGAYESMTRSVAGRAMALTDEMREKGATLAAKAEESAELMAQMLQALDEEIDEIPVTEEPTHRRSITPTEKTGTRLRDDGEGSFDFIPKDAAAQSAMKKLGRSTVEYRERQPDFSPFVARSTPWGELGCQVEIGHMTGVRDHSGKNDLDPGNYQSADEQLCLLLKKARPEQDVSPGKVARWRRDAELTWHECPDGYTMQLIPTVIHSACRHSGGVSEMNYRMAYGVLSLDQFEEYMK